MTYCTDISDHGLAGKSPFLESPDNLSEPEGNFFNPNLFNVVAQLLAQKPGIILLC